MLTAPAKSQLRIGHRPSPVKTGSVWRKNHIKFFYLYHWNNERMWDSSFELNATESSANEMGHGKSNGWTLPEANLFLIVLISNYAQPVPNAMCTSALTVSHFCATGQQQSLPRTIKLSVFVRLAQWHQGLIESRIGTMFYK